MITEIAVADLTIHPLNARSRDARPSAPPALVESIKALGILQPILVAPMWPEHGDEPSKLGVVAGANRFLAAKTLKHKMIPAIILPTASNVGRTIAVSMAENVVRQDMTVLDQWAAIERMTAAGLSIEEAGALLGMPAKAVGRMKQLAAMDKAVMDKIKALGILPADRDLRVIANAPAESQRAAIKSVGKGTAASYFWPQVASACRVVTIPRDFAIFDLDAHAIGWDRDWFAEEGQPEWLTSNVDGFMQAQTAALEAAAVRLSRGGRKAIVAKIADWGMSFSLPPGSSHGEMHDDLPDKVTIPKGATLVLGIRWNGRVVWSIANIPEGEAPADHVELEEPAAADEGADDAARPDDKPNERRERGLPKAAASAIAKVKTAAIAQALAGVDSVETLARLLLLALNSPNCSVPGNPDDRYAPSDNGNAERDLKAALRNQIAAICRFPDPLAPRFTVAAGPEADMIGWALCAELSAPRMDTAEILGAFPIGVLTEAAKAGAVTGLPKGAAIRDALVGRLPGWQPWSFTAPGGRYADMIPAAPGTSWRELAGEG